MAHLADQLRVEGLLGVEVGVEGAHGQLRPVRHFMDVGLEVALLPEEPPTRLQQALAHPRLQDQRQGGGGAAKDLRRIHREAAEEPAQEDAADRVELDGGAPGGPADRAEPQAAEGEEVFPQPDLPAQGRAKAALVEGHQPLLVVEVAILPLAEDRDQVRVLLREPEHRLGDAPHPRLGRGALHALHGLPDLIQHPPEDHLEERLLPVEVAVEDPVGQAGLAADLGHGHRAIPLLREELHRRRHQALSRLSSASALLHRDAPPPDPAGFR